mgnify:CR=1 FL=1
MDVVVKTKIEKIISEHDVVLFMKGTSNMPQCGFSSRVAGILNFLQVNFKDVNVLEDDEIRQGIFWILPHKHYGEQALDQAKRRVSGGGPVMPHIER